MDSGASKNTVPLWYELSNERDADIDIQCAGEDQVLKCETEGEDGVLGTSMKIKTGTPLLAIRPLDERGVATVFMGNKVYALTTSHMMALVEGAVAGGYGHIVGHAKPEWVYELTDRRALESVVRAADAGRAHVADDAHDLDQLIQLAVVHLFGKRNLGFIHKLHQVADPGRQVVTEV